MKDTSRENRNEHVQTFAILISDDFDNSAVLSGVLDDPDNWIEDAKEENKYRHHIFDDIILEIAESKSKSSEGNGNARTNYVYTLYNIDELYMQIMSSDLSTEYSDRVRLDNLCNTLAEMDDTNENKLMTGRMFRLNIQNQDLFIKERRSTSRSNKKDSVQLIF